MRIITFVFYTPYYYFSKMTTVDEQKGKVVPVL